MFAHSWNLMQLSAARNGCRPTAFFDCRGSVVSLASLPEIRGENDLLLAAGDLPELWLAPLLLFCSLLSFRR